MNRRTRQIASMCIAGLMLINTGCGKIADLNREEGMPVSRSQKMQTEAMIQDIYTRLSTHEQDSVRQSLEWNRGDLIIDQPLCFVRDYSLPGDLLADFIYSPYMDLTYEYSNIDDEGVFMVTASTEVTDYVLAWDQTVQNADFVSNVVLSTFLYEYPEDKAEQIYEDLCEDFRSTYEVNFELLTDTRPYEAVFSARVNEDGSITILTMQDDFDSSYNPFSLTDEVAESVNASVDEFYGIVPPVEISIIGTCNLIDIGI